MLNYLIEPKSTTKQEQKLGLITCHELKRNICFTLELNFSTMTCLMIILSKIIQKKLDFKT